MHSASSSHLHATEALLENALDFSQATWKKAGLLCENANSKVTAYRRHPPGKLDWNRASKGRTDIWKGKHAIPTDGNKKTIVIADPTLEIVKSGLLAQLLDQGFSLFCISIITNQ